MAASSGEGDEKDEYFTTSLDRFAKLVDERQKEIKLGVAGLALVGVAIIGRSIRVFTTFRYVSEIPPRFVSRHIKLRACVKQVDDQAVLHVQHIPIVELWEKSNVRLLPVTLSGGLNVLDPGRRWLQANMVNQVVWLTPTHVTHDDVLECIVTTRLVSRWWRSTDVNRELVLRGLAIIQTDPLLRNIRSDDRILARFETALMVAEATAQRRGRGAWARPSLLERALQVPAQLAGQVTSRVTTATQKTTEFFDRLRLRLLRR